MINNVTIYLYTTLKGPGKRSGGFCYLMECEHPQFGTQTVMENGIFTGVSEQYAYLDMLIKAFKRIKWPCEVYIYCDLPAIASGMHRWMEEWAKDDWKNARGKDVSNAEQWKELFALTRQHNITVNNSNYHSFRKIIEQEALKA